MYMIGIVVHCTKSHRYNINLLSGIYVFLNVTFNHLFCAKKVLIDNMKSINKGM